LSPGPAYSLLARCSSTRLPALLSARKPQHALENRALRILPLTRRRPIQARRPSRRHMVVLAGPSGPSRAPVRSLSFARPGKSAPDVLPLPQLSARWPTPGSACSRLQRLHLVFLRAASSVSSTVLISPAATSTSVLNLPLAPFIGRDHQGHQLSVAPH